jgi:hypothetical protein
LNANLLQHLDTKILKRLNSLKLYQIDNVTRDFHVIWFFRPKWSKHYSPSLGFKFSW